jgi:hypothetical protein
MSKGSREKHKRVEFEATDDVIEQDEFADAMCTQCGFFPKTATRDVCDCCAAMESPNLGSFK